MELGDDFVQRVVPGAANELRPPLAPIKILYLIRADHSVDGSRNAHANFERLALYPAGDGAENRQSDFRLYFSGDTSNAGRRPFLFVTGLADKVEPDYVPTLSEVAGYHASRPTGGPA